MEGLLAQILEETREIRTVVNNMDGRLNAVDARLNAVDARLNTVDDRLNNIELDIQTVRTALESHEETTQILTQAMANITEHIAAHTIAVNNALQHNEFRLMAYQQRQNELYEIRNYNKSRVMEHDEIYFPLGIPNTPRSLEEFRNLNNVDHLYVALGLVGDIGLLDRKKRIAGHLGIKNLNTG